MDYIPQREERGWRRGWGNESVPSALKWHSHFWKPRDIKALGSTNVGIVVDNWRPSCTSFVRVLSDFSDWTFSTYFVMHWHFWKQTPLIQHWSNKIMYVADRRANSNANFPSVRVAYDNVRVGRLWPADNFSSEHEASCQPRDSITIWFPRSSADPTDGIFLSFVFTFFTFADRVGCDFIIFRFESS